MLELRGVRVLYGRVPAIHGVSLSAREGRITSIVGSNGAGKTTLLNTIMGHLRPAGGEILYRGRPIHRLASWRIARLGIAHVPEGRGLFGRLTVRENLMLGAYAQKDRREVRRRLEEVYRLFPILEERQKQLAGTCSGGEQQMLAIARSLMAGPGLVMLDEPSLGVMPAYVTLIFDTLQRIRKAGATILLVEQNVERSLGIADYAFVLQTGRIVQEGPGRELLDSDLIRRAYLGL